MEGIDWVTAYGCDPEELRKMSVDAGLVVAAQRGLRFTYHNHDLEIKKFTHIKNAFGTESVHGFF